VFEGVSSKREWFVEQILSMIPNHLQTHFIEWSKLVAESGEEERVSQDRGRTVERLKLNFPEESITIFKSSWHSS
jgi:hypothetical protein